MTVRNDAIEQLVAALGHELRNPLAAAQLAARQLAAIDPCPRPPTEVIERQIGRLCDVVEQLIEGIAESADPASGTLDARVLTSALAARDPEPPTKASLPQTTMHVLIIDDNEDAAAMLSLVLQGRGATCTVLHDGEEAVKEMARRHYDLAIVDIGLPGMDGYEVARYAASLDTKPTRVIALSGYGRDQDRARARDAGFDAYYLKPLSAEALATILVE